MAANDNTDKLRELYTFDPAKGTFASGITSENVQDTAVMRGLVKGVLEDIFGAAEMDAATPLGRLVEWIALNFATAMRINVQNANQLVLSAAAGQQLDAIALWFGLKRKGATKTAVTATLMGYQDAEIPAGARARTSSGKVFALKQAVVLSNLGTMPDGETPTYTATGEFVCVEDGPVECLAGELSAIDTAFVGWHGVYNQSDGTLGRAEETDDALRARIDASRYSGIGFIGSMKNAIESIEEVNSSMVLENSTDAALTVGEMADELKPHSVFICVDCPDSADSQVAEAVFRSKPCGTGYTAHELSGVTEQPDPTYRSVKVYDAYGNPYDVEFHHARRFSISVALKVNAKSYFGVDLVGDVQNAITSWALSHGYRVGETVYASDIASAVESGLPGVVCVYSAVASGGTDAAEVADALSYQTVPADAVASFAPDDIAVISING